MSNEPTTTETITYPKPTPQTPPALVKKIGKTTYRVWAHFSTTSTETRIKSSAYSARKCGRRWKTSNGRWPGRKSAIIFVLAALPFLKSRGICGNISMDIFLLDRLQKAGDSFGHSRAKAP